MGRPCRVLRNLCPIPVILSWLAATRLTTRNYSMMKFRIILSSCLLLVLFLAPLAEAAADPLELELEGVSGELRDILIEALEFPPGMVNGEQVNRRWLARFSSKIPELVAESLQPLGYFHSGASSTLAETEPGHYVLRVAVALGEPLLITRLQLKIDSPAETPAALAKQLEEFPLQVGDPLRQDRYEAAKAALNARAIQLGFLDADFSQHQLLVHRGEQRAEIELTLATGPRYQFGPSRINGQGSYSDKFIQRYISFQPGEVFSQTKLGKTQSSLLDSDLFRAVVIRPRRDLAEDLQVPIEIELQPAPRHQLRPGIGFGTDTGARIQLRYRDLNLLDRGHELQGTLLLAQKRQTLVTTYIIPDLEELNSQTLLRVGYDREDIETFTRSSLFSEIERQEVLGDHLTGSAFLRLSQEYSNIAGEKDRARMLMPGVRLVWRKIDNLHNPKDISQLQLEMLGSSDALLSDTSLLQFSGSLTRLQPLPRNFALFLRLRGATTLHSDPLKDVPVSLRFFAGGDRSVRGYRYQSLGPKDADGQVIGGKHLLVANIELEKHLNENWGAAIFYDIGNAFDDFADYELEQAAGIGVRRYTTIGPIRVDLARRIGANPTKYRFHFSVGFGW